MPQEFQVLQCYSCQTFQVHQVKKALKWACKMCGEKQSLKKVFGRGSGAECRQHVQRLNTLRAELDHQTSNTHTLSQVEANMDSEKEEGINTDDCNNPTYMYDQCRDINQYNKETKWNMFVESTNIDHTDDGDDDDDELVYTTDAQKFKQGRKRKRENKAGNTYTKSSDKWCKYTNRTGMESFYNDNMSAMDRRTNKLSDFRTHENRSSACLTGNTEDAVLGRKSSFKIENYPENIITNSSQGRKGWYMSELNEPSSLESTADSFSERIQLQSHTRNVKTEPSADKDKKINMPVDTKWSLFTENDTSSRESSALNSQGPTEDSYDSMPYVTFDPEEAEHAESLACDLGQTDMSRLVENNFYHTKDNGSLSHNNSSKWTGFMACENSVVQSGQNNTFKQTSVINSENDHLGKNSSSSWADFVAVKENVSSSRQNLESIDMNKKKNIYSKWEAYTGDGVNESLSAENEKPFPQVSEPVGRPVLNNKVALQEHNKSFKQGYTDRGNKTEKVSTVHVFTAGDLNDADFEL